MDFGLYCTLYGGTRERIAGLLLLRLRLQKVLKFYFSWCRRWWYFFNLFFWSWNIRFWGIWATEINVRDFFITDFAVWRKNPICFLPSNSNWIFFSQLQHNSKTRWHQCEQASPSPAVQLQSADNTFPPISAITHAVEAFHSTFGNDWPSQQVNMLY